MLRGLIVGGVFALAAHAGAAHALCRMPPAAPREPNGATASEAEMKAGHDSVQAYVNELQSYQACLEKQIKDADKDTSLMLKQAWRAQGNAAIDEANDVAAAYADQYKIFKARHGK